MGRADKGKVKMSDAIVVALITAAASVLCNVIVTRKAAKETDIKRAVFEQTVNDRLGTIEQKLDTHNGYAEKIGGIQLDMAVIKNEIKNLKGA